jgi:hypothetical protein
MGENRIAHRQWQFDRPDHRYPRIEGGQCGGAQHRGGGGPGLGETNVLGMNFLTKLKGWRVEDRVMVLEPHHPTNEDADRQRELIRPTLVRVGVVNAIEIGPLAGNT